MTYQGQEVTLSSIESALSRTESELVRTRVQGYEFTGKVNIQLIEPYCIAVSVSLGRASGVCRDWYNLANEGSLWRTFCALPKWKLSRAAGQKQILQHILPDGGVHVSNTTAI